MLKWVTWAAFNTVAIIAATGMAVWLTLTGHTVQIGGLFFAIAGVLTTVRFAFRLAGAYGPGELSIWAGPFSSLQVGTVDRTRR